MPLYRIRCKEKISKAEQILKKAVDKQELLFGMYIDVGYERAGDDLLYHFEYKKAFKSLLTRGDSGKGLMDKISVDGLKKLKQRFKKERVPAVIILEQVDYGK